MSKGIVFVVSGLLLVVSGLVSDCQRAHAAAPTAAPASAAR